MLGGHLILSGFSRKIAMVLFTSKLFLSGQRSHNKEMVMDSDGTVMCALNVILQDGCIDTPTVYLHNLFRN